MAEFTLHARSAFGHAEAIVEYWSGFEIREVLDHSIASVAVRRGKTELLNAEAQTAFSVLPPGPGRSASAAGITFDWMGQGQWFVSAAREDSTTFTRELTDGLGESASVSDQSDAWIELQITGSNCRTVLEKLCPLDLHPKTFAAGSVARTVVEHTGAIVALINESPKFRLLTARSSARSFLNALRVAAGANTAR